MSSYIAVTQGTAGWLLGKSTLLNELHDILAQPDEKLKVLTIGELSEGAFRLNASDDATVFAVWNIDYLTGSGEEAWGLIKRDGALGLLNERSISREVLERCLYVINQRLQGLYIDGSHIHRKQENGAHTCVAGRGSSARQLNIGYFERSVDASSAMQHAIICVGPAFDYNIIANKAAAEALNLNQLLEKANTLTSPSRKRIAADHELFSKLRHQLASYTQTKIPNEYAHVEVATGKNAVTQQDMHRSAGLTYLDWIAPNSPLSDIQRRILFSDAIARHPLRIVGPGGSGKTLLMQLLALRCLELAKKQRKHLRVLYFVHNSAMVEMVKQRFDVLDSADTRIRNVDLVLDVYTLAEYGRRQLGLENESVLNLDAYEAKLYQMDRVSAALNETMKEIPEKVAKSRLFSAMASNPELLSVISALVMSEISTAIKGHGLEGDKRRYIESERRLSRFHGILDRTDRELVFHTYEKYHAEVFEQNEVLDTDDVAISLLGRLRTPIWALKRRKLGYDYVFVDETQLFNENERKVLPLFTNGTSQHVPIVLALDEAQDIYSQSTAGMATLGIPDITNESLSSIHRSTREIVRLAFFVIQRSVDLFGPDFPDFTDIGEKMESGNHPLAEPPLIEIANEGKLGKFVKKRIGEFRKKNLRQIAVICHADQYWDALEGEFKNSGLPLHILLQRGEKLTTDPLVVLTKPQYAGGQEFDAVILVGLEQGIVPPRIADNDALSSAVEQQSLREIYLAVTRARYRLVVILSAGSTLTSVLQEAERGGLLVRRQSAHATL